MQEVVIIGAGAHAREVLDVFDAVNQVARRYYVLGFIVEPGFGTPGELVNDLPILGGVDWLETRAGALQAICGVGAPELRRRLATHVAQRGVPFCSIVHPNAVLTRWVTMGSGVMISAGCVLTNRVRIGNHAHVNVGCTISHDCLLEDFVTLAPGVHAAGGVRFREGCSVGVGTSIIPRCEVGAWSTVGAGSAIIRDVPANSTVAGVPGSVLMRQAGRHHLP
ncbi:MAG: acetyltransferase [Candidatus Binatia bacterium]